MAASITLGDAVKASSLQKILCATTEKERDDVRGALNRLVKRGYFVHTDPNYNNLYKSNTLNPYFPYENVWQIVDMHIANNADPYGSEILRSLALEGKYPDSLPYKPTMPITEEPTVNYFPHIPFTHKPLPGRPWEPLGPALFYLATLEYLHEEPLPLERFKTLVGGSFSTATKRYKFMLENDHIRQVVPTMAYFVKGRGRKPTRLSVKDEGKEAIKELRKLHDRFKDNREYHHFYNSLKSYLHANIPSDKALSFNSLEPIFKPAQLQELDSSDAA